MTLPRRPSAALNPEASKRLAECPTLYKPVLERTYRAKSSPRSAIKAFCLQCTGYVRQDITACTASGCPLHPYRPYQE